jgi:hypothetical protein
MSPSVSNEKHPHQSSDMTCIIRSFAEVHSGRAVVIIIIINFTFVLPLITQQWKIYWWNNLLYLQVWLQLQFETFHHNLEIVLRLCAIILRQIKCPIK